MDRLDGMRTLVAVARAGGFTAAAERLNLSPKLASKYVAELEARLGVRLLARTTRRVGLTEAGARFLPRAAAILEEVEDLEASLREEAAGPAGTLRVAAPVTFGEMYAAPLLRDLLAMHPDLALDLRLSDAFVDLAEEGFDLAIRIGALPPSGLIARRLGRTELWAVASPGLLARHGAPASPAALADLPCVHDGNLRSGREWPFEVDGAPARVPVRARITVGSARAAAGLAIAGEGVALCPDYVAAPEVEAGRLVRVLDGFPSLVLDIHAVRLVPARTRVAIDHLARRFSAMRRWTDLARSE